MCIRDSSWIVRGVRERVCRESADSKEGRRDPAIGEVTRQSGERHDKDRRDSHQPGLTCHDEMRQGQTRETPAHHQNQADGARLYGLMAAERESELMSLVEDAAHATL